MTVRGSSAGPLGGRQPATYPEPVVAPRRRGPRRDTGPAPGTAGRPRRRPAARTRRGRTTARSADPGMPPARPTTPGLALPRPRHGFTARHLALHDPRHLHPAPAGPGQRRGGDPGAAGNLGAATARPRRARRGVDGPGPGRHAMPGPVRDALAGSPTRSAPSAAARPDIDRQRQPCRHVVGDPCSPRSRADVTAERW